MCGRFTLRQPANVQELFPDAERPDNVLPLFDQPRYNIAPSQPVLAVYQSEGEAPQWGMLTWGLIPFWVKDLSKSKPLINARSETVRDKSSFRKPFRKQRCLIFGDGFYEWKTQKGVKQPYHFHLHDDRPFAFAGLWDVWKGENEEPLQTCTILTTEANDVVKPVHPRMPVILPEDHYKKWLDPAMDDLDGLQQLLIPFDKENLVAYPVSTKVNNSKFDTPECVTALAD